MKLKMYFVCLKIPMKVFLLFFSFCIGCSEIFSQAAKTSARPAVIAFWNVENLYDTLNDDRKNDDDFTPDGIYRWNGDRYRLKLSHLSQVIRVLGTHLNKDGPSIMGFCEVENKQVMLDLVREPILASLKYEVVHIEGPDARGIDPAFIYQPTYFKLLKPAPFLFG
jgi:hypothetical protein